MAVSFNDTQRRYDRLIQLIIQELDRLFDDLSQDKKKIKERRNTIAHEVHAQKMEFVADKKAEMVTKVEVAKFNNGSPYRIPTSSLQPLFALEVQLEQLIVQEINIERREAITIKDDPARIDNEITIIKEIIAYLKDNAGNKGKRRGLTREAGNALHDKIKDVYDSVLTREEEANLTATHFEPLKAEIENKVGQIIAQIDAIIEKIPSGAPPEVEVPAKDALHVIKREAGYWMFAYKILEELVQVAHSSKNIEQAKKLLKQLKTRERREQLMAPVSKIKKGLRGIELPEAEINGLIERLKIFEGKTLIDTVNLEELLKSVEGVDFDWGEVVKEAEKVMRDLQAAIKIIQDLKAKLDEYDERAKQKSIARARAKRARGPATFDQRKAERVRVAEQNERDKAERRKAEVQRQRIARRLAESKNRPDFRGDKEKRTKAYQEAAAQKKAIQGSIRRQNIKAARDLAYSLKIEDRRLQRKLERSRNRPDFRGDKAERIRVAEQKEAEKRKRIAIEKSIARNRAKSPSTFDERKAERIRIAQEAIEAENTQAIIDADRAREEAKGVRSQRSKDTNLQGGGRRGFKSNPKYSGGKKRGAPRNLRMRPTGKRSGFQSRPGYNRAAGKAATRREIEDEGY